MRGRVVAARDLQRRRQGKCNARLLSREIDAHCVTDRAGNAFLAVAAARLALSARAFHRVLKVARTIADVAGDAQIETRHLAEAVGYRGMAGR